MKLLILTNNQQGQVFDSEPIFIRTPCGNRADGAFRVCLGKEIVTKDLPPEMICVGVPARPLKPRPKS